MKTIRYVLLLLLASCSGVNSSDDDKPEVKDNEPGVIIFSLPEVLQTDSTYTIDLEIIDIDTLDQVSIKEQLNDSPADSFSYEGPTTHLDTSLTRNFDQAGDYTITITATDRHPDQEVLTKKTEAEIAEVLVEHQIAIRLFNSVRDKDPDGVTVQVYDTRDTLISEGEIENGIFEFETESVAGRTETLRVEFYGHSYIDFSDEFEYSSSGEFEFSIDPAPIEIETLFPELTPGESMTIDVRDYAESVDPDDEEPVSFESAEFSDPDTQLHIEEQDDFIFEITADEGISESILTARLTLYTEGNTETETIEFPIEDPGEVTPTHLVIMPLGDSMTNDSRSRVTLWNLLEDDGHTIDYVGDQHQGSSIPDPDHEGVGGITIQEVIDKADDLMKRHDPEYVNLMIGTNDIAWYTDEEMSDVAARWNDLIQILLDSSSSDTYIIAATIPPVTSEGVGEDDRDRAELVKEFNEYLRDYIEARQDDGDLIVIADMEEELDPEEHLASDGVHLNREGYIVMGTVYYEAITSVLLKN